MSVRLQELNGQVNKALPPEPSGFSPLGALLGLGQTVAGAITGNPIAIASGGLSTLGSLGKSTPLQIAGIGGKVGGVATGIQDAVNKIDAATQSSSPTPNAASTQDIAAKGTAQPLVDAGDAIGRRAADVAQNPTNQVHQALALANDKSLPLDYDTRMSIIEPLLRAKIYGAGGGLSNGGMNDFGPGGLG